MMSSHTELDCHGLHGGCCLCGLMQWKLDIGLLSFTPDTHIFNMATVVHTNPSVLAVIQSSFIAKTQYIVQPNGFISLTKDESSCPCVKIETSNKEQCMMTFQVNYIRRFGTYQMRKIPVVCRLRQHWWAPTCCHSLFPMLHCSKSQLDLQHHPHHHLA